MSTDAERKRRWRLNPVNAAKERERQRIYDHLPKRQVDRHKKRDVLNPPATATPPQWQAIVTSEPIATFAYNAADIVELTREHLYRAIELTKKYLNELEQEGEGK